MHAVPPDRPLNLTLESVSNSWVAIQWQAPNDLGSYGISYYNVNVYKIVPHNNTEMPIAEISTEGNETHANITGLQSGMIFKLNVAGIVSLRHGDFIVSGQVSDPLFYSSSTEGKKIILAICMV